jgi:hypothetical protein
MRPRQERTGPPATERPARSGTANQHHEEPTAEGDPRRIGELLSDWLAIRMTEVDALVDEARAKTAAIPDQRQLWLLVGELVVRVHCLELAADQQRKAARR